MKHLYKLIVAAIVCAPFTVNGQNFTCTPDHYSAHEVVNTNFETIDIYITTPTPEDITFEWTVTNNTFPAGWNLSICDYTGCYPGNVTSATMTALTAAEMQSGTQAFLKLNLTTGMNPGNGILEFYVYDQADPNRGDTVTFDVTLPANVGMEENAVLLTQVGPNPVNEQLNFTVGNEEVTVSIIDLTGKVLESKLIPANTVSTLDFSNYATGVYMLQSVSASGTVVTERIVKR